MDVELFVHGVPSGEDFWGKPEDRNYFGNFYDGSQDEVKFLIQKRLSQGKMYCYYNYLVYRSPGAQQSNVVAYDGRDGSYFGISLRLDAYCKNFLNMFRILDILYYGYIMGRVLNMDKAKLRYMAQSFASVDGVLKEAQDIALQLIQRSFKTEDFAAIDSTAASGGSCPTWNLYECTADNVMKAVWQHGRVALSPYYPSAREAAVKQQCETSIQNLRQQYEKQLRKETEARESEKRETSSKISNLQQQLTARSSEVTNLQSEVKNLQSQIDKTRQVGTVEMAVSTIKDPVQELASILGRMYPAQKKDNKNPKWMWLIVSGIVVAVLFFAYSLFFGSCKDSRKEKDRETSYEEVSTGQRNDQRTRAWSEDNHATSSEGMGRDAGRSSETPSNYGEYADEYYDDDYDADLDASRADISRISLDIKPYNGRGPLKLYNTYTVEARGGNGQGTWDCEGGTIRPDYSNPDKATFHARDTGGIVIIYAIGDQQKTRQLSVTE